MAESKDWSYDEFLCFLLIYVSHVDIEYSDDEIARLRRMFSNDIYEKMYAEFDKMSDYQALQAILSFKDQYYPNEHRKKELMDNIKIQLFVDGEFTIMEKEIFHFLDKML